MMAPPQPRPPVFRSEYEDGVDDFSRADLMTPFSLSLAAERAIENAKRNLDAMDARILHAKSSVARAQRLGLRRVSSPLPSSALPISPSRGRTGEDEREKKAVEMRKLSDDLRGLRSRLSESRAITETLNLTPPRRPPRPSAGELPNLALLASTQDPRRDGLLVGNLATAPAVDARWQRRSEPPSVHPIVQTVGRFVRPWPDRPFAAGAAAVGEQAKEDEEEGAMMMDNPFSPRPYSSQSVLTPWSPSPPTTSTLTSNGTTPPARSTRSSGLSTTTATSPGSTPSSEDGRAIKTTATSPPRLDSPSRIPRSSIGSGRRDDTLSRRLAAVLSKIDAGERRPEGPLDGERRRRLEAAVASIEALVL